MNAPTNALQLVPPSVAYRATFMEALREFRAEGLPWWGSEATALAERDFAAFVAAKLADATGHGPAPVPKTHRWALLGEQFVGRISVHHTLTDALRESGGHIGYDTLPSMRGRGIATRMLALVLPVAKALGLDEVLLTCDETNAASIRVIEANGGQIRGSRRVGSNGRAKRRYWIQLHA